MEILGGFIIMMCILGFFVVVVWLVMPLVLYGLKLRQDKTLSALADIETRLAAIEDHLAELNPGRDKNVADTVQEELFDFEPPNPKE